MENILKIARHTSTKDYEKSKKPNTMPQNQKRAEINIQNVKMHEQMDESLLELDFPAKLIRPKIMTVKAGTP